MNTLSDLLRAVESLEQTMLALLAAIEAYQSETHLSRQDELTLMAAVSQVYSLTAQISLENMSHAD